MSQPRSTYLKRNPGKSLRFACFSCRLCFHRARGADSLDCPSCRQPMSEMGSHFRAPRRDDRKAWRILQALCGLGVRFGSGGGWGILPRNSSELAAFRSRRIALDVHYWSQSIRRGR